MLHPQRTRSPLPILILRRSLLPHLPPSPSPSTTPLRPCRPTRSTNHLRLICRTPTFLPLNRLSNTSITHSSPPTTQQVRYRVIRRSRRGSIPINPRARRLRYPSRRTRTSDRRPSILRPRATQVEALACTPRPTLALCPHRTSGRIRHRMCISHLPRRRLHPTGSTRPKCAALNRSRSSPPQGTTTCCRWAQQQHHRWLHLHLHLHQHPHRSNAS